jgi:hypothetical protein
MRRCVLAICVVLGACGLFPDISGLTGGDAGIDASTQDAGVDAMPPVDARLDTTTDSPSSVDSGIGDAGYCATHTGHTFCEDFDEPNFESRWTGVQTTAGASVVESDAGFVSPPNELLATATFPASSGAAAYAYKHFATANSIKIQLEMLVTMAGLPQIDPLMIFFNPPPAGYTHYEIHIDSGDGHFGYNYTPDGGTNTNPDVSFTTPIGAWHAFEVDIDMTTSNVQVLVDGVSQVNTTLLATVSPTAFDLRVGVVSGLGGTTAATGIVQVDNVLVDTK